MSYAAFTQSPSPSGATNKAGVDTVAILDCGAQYTKVIDRRVRECSVATVIVPVDTPASKLKELGIGGIIISGGPNSVYDADSPQCDPAIFSLGVPVLGICYGMQLMAQTLGGTVSQGSVQEYGETDITVDPQNDLFNGLAATQTVLMSHGDKVTQLPHGFEQVATSPDKAGDIVAAMANTSRQFYGVQFHPEVELTEHGQAMLDGFLKRICQFKGNFKLTNRLENLLDEIRTTVGTRNVFVLVSGGVDSSVTAALLLNALGPERVFAVHIDSGLMRHNESDLVCDALKALGLNHLSRLNAADDFFNGTTILEDGTKIGPLCKTTDPEHKRRIIGDVFYHLITRAIAESNCDVNSAFIAQGTLRPDLIESGNRDVSDTAHTIKTHHNDVPLIQAHREKGLIIEPNRDLHKDEVREMGRLLGLPEALVARQPFPGPGLGIRLLCATQPALTDAEQTEINQQCQHVVAPHGGTAMVLPIRSVGVQGDGRSYRCPVVINGISDTTVMRQLSASIPNTIHTLNRVTWWLGDQGPSATPTFTPTLLTPETTEKLRAVDNAVTQAIVNTGKLQHISQLLTVLLPVSMSDDADRTHSVVIRGVVTSDFMTARSIKLGEKDNELPLPWLHDLANTLHQQFSWLGGVVLDTTGKPPATVEWE